ncbi:biotin carboxylase N-terminal domain-containing protein [uncultured Piscinibacter sp.]|uniref:acetyl-CoA carboxylase biotin carboxylase subunit n=1 Tax=uncultured Piscinibacter sp. TaxID=1131835 RepID=UPI0026273D71|nr:biotin carboxylase N-terminal domain-containing protein [uncultured Piscinibacter sp.]
MSFETILVANRGEIACRVMRSARALGYRTVAVYSDADADAPHAQQADLSVHIGGSPAGESYLNAVALIEAARRSGADAVHPGYGFLSENAGFAQACHAAGLVFIGPPPEAIMAMGDKVLAKRRMHDAGVPCAPGSLGVSQDDAQLHAEALRLGFPLLVKAVAGGGGRGMRLVTSADGIAEALAGARREAKSAFADETLMLERLIEHGRHIEIQVFADTQGHVIHLGERDCSAQRRRQKVVEESPSPVVSPELREAMGRDAVAAARAVGYVGAGTVEFIVDQSGRHFFLEMNTRLQVEHPVTEMVTGLDLVEWQLRIAAGEPLPLTQEQVVLRGHAIEVRLYAEDPYAGFAPQIGPVLHWRPEAALRPGVRIDHGLAEGQRITPFYDAMVAKLVAHGRDRADAIRRLRAALADAPLLGLRHNGRFLRDLLDHGAFRHGEMTTQWLDDGLREGAALFERPRPCDEDWCVAAAAFALRDGAPQRPDSVAAYDLSLACDGAERTLRVRPGRGGEVGITFDGVVRSLRLLGAADCELRYEWLGVARRVVALWHDDALHLAREGAVFVFDEPSARPRADRLADPGHARAPVAGVVARLAVGEGDAVAAGQPLACVEAMKMEMWVAAGAAGRVARVAVRPGQQVAAGTLLVELELADPAAD